MVEKCRGKVARVLRIICPELRSANDNVPQKLGVTPGASGMVSGVTGGGWSCAISKSSTFGRRERKAKKTAGSNVQNRRLNVRNDLPK